MKTKRVVAGAAALVVAGSGSLFLASTAAGQGDEENHEGHDMDHGNEDSPVDVDPETGDITVTVEGEQPAGEETPAGDGSEAEGAPAVTDEPDFTG